jgi:predicted RNA binding protein YcfA (HicA-like mRNA interferase family)
MSRLSLRCRTSRLYGSASFPANTYRCKPMKRRDLERALALLGWRLDRRGGKHDVWVRRRRRIAVPRHSEIAEYTARAILAVAGEDE